MCECVSLEKWVECKKGGDDLGEEEEKCGVGVGEQWACKRGGVRGMRVEKGEREGKCLTGERGSWRTTTEAIFTLQREVSYF